MVNCVPVFVPTDAQHQPDVGALERAITPRTRVVVTVSPNNPTGAVYPETTLRQINRLCALRGIYHFSDEAYEYFTYADVPHFSPGSIHGAYRHTISFFSLSKSFGFAGWRVGYVVLPEHLLLSMRKVQDTNLICAAMPSQYAAIGALRAGYAYTAKWIPDLRRVRDTVLTRLVELGSRVSVVETSGAFYAFARVNDTQMSDLELVRWLVEVHQIAVVPGSAFGCEEGCWLRISYGALRPESVIEGIGRLTKGLQAIPA
jgi:aspartate/methionine/tyrosine aminotransferase